MQRSAPLKREKLPGQALVGIVVAAVVWLVLFRLDIKDIGIRVMITGLIGLLTILFYSDQVANRLDDLLYDPNYNPQILMAEKTRQKGRWRYQFLPSWKRMHAKRTVFGAGLRPPLPENGEGVFDRARTMLTAADRKAVEAWLGNSKALRSIVPLLTAAASVEFIIALAWQPPEQRTADLLIGASELILAVAATRAYLVWRVRYLEELYERAHRTNIDRHPRRQTAE